MEFFEIIGKATTLIGAVLGLIWAFEKWWRREEHFPRVNFDIEIEHVDQTDEFYLINVLAKLENKGVVPLRIKDFVCEIRGIKVNDDLVHGGDEIRNQLNFSHPVIEGTFIPKSWDSSFVHPGVKTEYNYVTTVSTEYRYILVKGRFGYLKTKNKHHAGKVLKLGHP